MLRVGAGVTPLMMGRINRPVIVPLLGAAFALSGSAISAIFGAAAVAEILMVAPAGVVMDRWGRAAVAVPCSAVMGVGYLLLTVLTATVGGSSPAASVVALAVPCLLIAVGNGLGSGIVMTLGIDVSPQRGRTRYLSWWNTVIGTGRLAAPLLVAAVALVAPMTVAAAASGILCLAGAAWLRRELPRAVPRAEGAPAEGCRRRPSIWCDVPVTESPAVAFTDLAVLRQDVLMLDGASGRVDPGGILGLTGANGAGKTTVLRVLAGMIRPTAGTVTVCGHRPDDRIPAFRRALAALIDPPQTARDLTIVEHLQFIAATWGADRAAAEGTARDLLDELAIAPLARRYPHELSSGQTQLVGLALTLARPFDVLLLDEPEQRLDADRLGQVIDAIRRRARAGAAVVLASHSPRLLEELADDRLHLEGDA